MTMSRVQAISVLTSHAQEIQSLGATSLYLFGSAARDELTDASDIDVFIDYDPQSAFSFVEFVRLKDLLEARLGRDVDLTTRSGLHPRLKSEIERSSIRVL